MPNPHVVVRRPIGRDLERLDLTRPPAVDPPLPNGQNVEFVLREGPAAPGMRVHERGVGETRSCGTGICAVVLPRSPPGRTGPTVRRGASTCPAARAPSLACGRDIELTGPAVLVAAIDLDEAWLAAVAAD